MTNAILRGKPRRGPLLCNLSHFQAVAALSFACLLQTASAFADTIRVRPGDDLQSAVNRANVVRFARGLYELPAGSLSLRSGVRLVAEGTGTVLTASFRVTGWRRVPFSGRDDVWCAEFDKAKASTVAPLFFADGRRMELCRYPNAVSGDIHSGWAEADEPLSENEKATYPSSPSRIVVRRTDFRRWSHPEEGVLDVVPRHNWMNHRTHVKSLDEAHSAIEFPRPVGFNCPPWGRWAALGFREELDIPGEWYLDRREGKVYFIPPGGADPNRIVCRLAAGHAALELRRVRDVEVCGLEVAWSERGILAERCTNVTVRSCLAHDIGGWWGNALSFNCAVRCTVKDCEIHDIGGYGVRFERRSMDRVLPPGGSNGNCVKACMIRKVGLCNKHGIGIDFYDTGFVCTDNVVEEVPRGGIFPHGRENLVRGNRISDCNLETDDTAAIYLGGWRECAGTRIAENVISNSVGFGWRNGRWEEYVGASGIYVDECGGGVTITGNVVTCSSLAGVMFHNARFCTVEGNFFSRNTRTFADRSEAGEIRMTGWDNHPKAMFVSVRQKDICREYDELLSDCPAWTNHPSIADSPHDPYLPSGCTMKGNVIRGNVFDCRSDPEVRFAVLRAYDPKANEISGNEIRYPGPEPAIYAFPKTVSRVANLGSSNRIVRIEPRRKRLLAIGDSITAAGLWQPKAAETLGWDVRTHARGGIGILKMVDGDSGKAPPGYDPDRFDASRIHALDVRDVSDVDAVLLLGFYNERRRAVQNRGDVTDLYPAQTTFCGVLNYAVARVREELKKAGNGACRIMLATPHRYGKYPWSDLTSEDDGEAVAEAIEAVAARNGIPCLDVMNQCGIGPSNWSVYQSSPVPANPDYLPCGGAAPAGTNAPFSAVSDLPDPSRHRGRVATVIGRSVCFRCDGERWTRSQATPCAWNGDQLHLNREGYRKLGWTIACELIREFRPEPCEAIPPPDGVTAAGEGFTNELSFADGRWTGGGVTVEIRPDGDVRIASPSRGLSWVAVDWHHPWPQGAICLADAWERAYGTLGWKPVGDEDRLSPWYFLTHAGGRTGGYGVMVQPNALACWIIRRDGHSLRLDVRAGGSPVRLGGRTLHAVRIVTRRGILGETAFEAGRAFCRLMCPVPRLPKDPVYGYNDWYCAYGSNTATNFLRDAAYIADCAKGLTNRPYVVMDDGWQLNSPFRMKASSGHFESGTGPWDAAGPHFGMDMGAFCRRIVELDARPGLWYRPFRAWQGVPEGELLAGNPKCVDPTVPEVRRRIVADMSRFRNWGFRLVKVDYLTYDICRRWCRSQDEELFADGSVTWRDRSRTTCEVMKDVYCALREAAGDDVILLGCNALNHLAAGLFEVQRIGDDTSGEKWWRTKEMGVNAIGFRGVQDRVFFLADADCVGLARAGAIPWSQNRQWLNLLSRSGTPLFVSWHRHLADSAFKTALKKAFETASKWRTTGEPLDWMSSMHPSRWRMADGPAGYSW